MAACHHVHARAFELAGQRHAGTAIPTGKHPVLADQQRDLAACLAPQRGELQGYRPRTDDDRAIRERVLLKRLRGIDQCATERFAGQRAGAGPGGQHHVRRIQPHPVADRFRHSRLDIPQHGLTAGGGRDRDLTCAGKRSLTAEHGDAAMRHQTGQTLDHRVHGAHPVVAQRAEIESGHLHLQSGDRRPLRRVHRVRGGQQRLRGDAPAVQAGAAERGVAFHQGDGQPQFRRTQRRRVPAGTRPNDDDIECLRHRCLLSIVNQ